MPCLDYVLCESCAKVPLPQPRQTAESQGPSYALALEVTNMRLAIEIARPAILLGKYAEAVQALDLATAPTKKAKRKGSRV